MRPKKMESLVKSLVDREVAQYGSCQYINTSGKTVSLTYCKLSDLQPKVNEGKIILGKVVCSINSNDPVPLYVFFLIL